MGGRWPYPGDSPLARARKVAHMYRTHLRAQSREVCDQADQTAVSFGETWVVPQVVTVDDKALLTPAEAADWLCISVAAVRRLRLAGRLAGERIGSEWRYRLADLRQLQESTRPRRRRVDQASA